MQNKNDHQGGHWYITGLRRWPDKQNWDGEVRGFEQGLVHDAFTDREAISCTIAGRMLWPDRAQMEGEVLRNLFELNTGETLNPEMLAREDHPGWFRKSHQRMGHWGLPEVLERARRVRTDLLAPLIPPTS